MRFLEPSPVSSFQHSLIHAPVPPLRSQDPLLAHAKKAKERLATRPITLRMGRPHQEEQLNKWQKTIGEPHQSITTAT